MDISQLKGVCILIGREPGSNRLSIAATFGNTTKTVAMGAAGSVPKSVSRYKAENGTAHCKIDVNNDDTVTVTSMNPDNVMFLKGVALTSKRVQPQTVVELGHDHYAVNIATILSIVAKLVGAAPAATAVPTFSIAHLEQVWDDYHNGDITLQKQQSRLGLLSSVPLFFTMGSGGLAALSKQFNWPNWITGVTTAMFVIGIIIMAYGFYLKFTFHYIDKKEALKDKFLNQYVCPNPKCHNFVGNSPYKIVKQNKKCPKCGCTWTDK